MHRPARILVVARWGWIAASACIALALALPAAANAGVTLVKVRAGGQVCDIKGCVFVPDGFELRGTAGPDQVTLSGGTDGTVLVEDPGGVLGCAPISPTRGACGLAGLEAIDLGDGADSASLAGLAAPLPALIGRGQLQLGGGRGNDVLVGSRFADGISGGDGADVISTGDGADDLTGGPGNDVLDGGAGPDNARFGALADVDLLRPSPNGPAGENDRLVSIERLQSGPGGRLAGDDGPNVLDAFGPTTVFGRGGDDVLSGRIVDGGPGDDIISGTPSDPYLRASQGGQRPIVTCGPGRDRIDAVDATPLRIDTDCERVDAIDRYRLDLALSRRSALGVVARVRGLRCRDPDPCRASLVIRARSGGRFISRRAVLGRTRTRYRARPGALVLRLSKPGRARFRRRARTEIRVELTIREEGLTEFIRILSRLDRR